MEGQKSKNQEKRKKIKMAKQLHVIHRHTPDHLTPYTGNTESAYVESADLAKLALGEIAVQHNETDPALYIKVGETSASTKYVKFAPGGGVESIGVEGDAAELTGEVLFSSGDTVGTGQTLDEVGFAIESGVVKSYVILDSELDEESSHAVANSAITKVIYDNEEIVSAAINDLNERISEISGASISGEGVISVSGSFDDGFTISHDDATINRSTTAETLVSEGTFQAISNVGEDSYGHVTAVTATTYTLPASVTTVTATGDTYVGATVTNGSAITISTNASASLSDSQVSGSVADAKAVVDYVKDKLGALKNVTTIGGVAVPTSAATYTVESGSSLVEIQTAADGASGIKTTITPVTGATTSSTVGLATNVDVKNYIDELLTSVMHFRGTANALPATAQTGDIYIVGTEFNVPNVGTAEVGDYIVYYQAEGAQSGEWNIIEKNDTGAVTSTGLTAGALVLADGAHSLVSAGTVGSATNPIYLNNGVPTPITAAASGTSELVFGSAVTLATIEGIDIVAELPELPEPEYDTELDSGSTNAVQNSAITMVILENEEAVAAALNDLNDRKAEKSDLEDLASALTNNYYTKEEVDELIDEVSVEVVNCGATITTAQTTLATVAGTAITANVSVSNEAAVLPVNSASATTMATVAGQDITGKVSMETLTIAGANGLADGITFDGTTAIEILTLDCGEY